VVHEVHEHPSKAINQVKEYVKKLNYVMLRAIS
jgi:hypothetical protein